MHAIFGNSNRPVTTEDIKQAIYVDWVMKESMRLFPIAFIIGRETTADVKFGTKPCHALSNSLNCYYLYQKT